MQLRNDHPDEPGESSPSRLNLLLSCGSWREHSAVRQLPRLLSPMGITSIEVGTGEEAAVAIRTQRVHIAVVDLAIPLSPEARERPGGARILKLLRRLEPVPPTVVVRPAQPETRESVRTLSEALREGAFAVLDRPVDLEAMLEVLRRILRRHYAGAWPDGGPAPLWNDN